jgi:flagellar biosynthesis protein
VPDRDDATPAPGRDGARPRAAALRYDPGRADAPVVTAAGHGLVAERILAEAARAGVPVRRDPALAEALARLPIGQEVPEELFGAVAAALAWAYSLDLEARRRDRAP